MSTIEKDPRLASALKSIAEIDWSGLSTVYGPADAVPGMLITLLTGNEDQADKSSHELWCVLAYARLWVPEAALYALPFVLLALERASPRLEPELLDLCWGFAVGNTWSPPLHATPGNPTPPWRHNLHAELCEYFSSYTGPKHVDEETLSLVAHIREALDVRTEAGRAGVL